MLVPVLTFMTMWVKSLNARDERRDNRDDGYIKALSDRVNTCEKRHADRDREISEIRVEMKTRDIEYAKLYQEHATIRAKYEVLVTEHDALRKEYNATVEELAALKEAIKKDRVLTSDLADHTAKTI